MSLRALLLYGALALLLLLLIGVLVWPFLRIDEKLRNYIISELRKSLPGEVELKRATPGFFALNLYGVEFQDRNKLYSVKIEAIKIEFGLMHLLSSRFNVLKSITAISLQHPEASIRLPASDSLSSNNELAKTLGWEIINGLPDELWLHQLNLNAGTIHLLTPEGVNWWTISNLGGELHSARPKVLSGRLRGGPSVGAPSGEIVVALDVRTQTLEVSLQTKGGDINILGMELGIRDSVYFALDSMDVNLRLWVKGAQNGLEGTAEFLGLDFQRQQENIFRCDTLMIYLNDWLLTVPQTKIKGISIDWMIAGRIPNLKKPILEFSFVGNSNEAQQLTQYLPDSTIFYPSGQLRLNGQVYGAIVSPIVQFEGNLEQLTVGWEIFNSIQLRALYHERRLKIENLSAHTQSRKFEGSGDLLLDTVNPNYNINLTWDGQLPFLTNLIPGHLHANIKGDSNSHRLSGSWQSSEILAPLIEIEATYTPDQKVLSAQVGIPSDTAQVQLLITEFPKQPFYRLEFSLPISVLRQFYRGEGWDHFKGIRCSGKIAGDQRHANYKLNIVQPSSDTEAQFAGKMSSDPTTGLTFSSTIAFNQGSSPALSGEMEVNWNKGDLTLRKFELEDAISAQGSIDWNTGEISSVELSIANLEFGKIIGMVVPTWRGRVGGYLDGRFEVYGELQNPQIFVNLYASRGFIMQQNGFWAVLSAELKDHNLSITECNVGKDILGLLKLNGSAAMDGSNLNFSLVSQRADAANILQLFNLSPVYLSGALQLAAQLKGSINQPELEVTLQVPSGKLFKMPFISLNAALKMDSNTNYLPKITEFSLVQSSDLSITSTGQLPFRNTPLHLTVSVEGNILKIPNLIESKAIPASSGQGRIAFDLDQVDGKIRVSNASFNLQNGMMRFKDVVNEIQNIQARMHLEKNQVIIDQLSGEIERQEFKISNSFSLIKDTVDFKHLYFSGIDVDLGVITVYTEGRGIYAEIPAVMVTGSKGYFRFQGKSDGEPFIIAGPIQNPLFQGIVNASGTTVTFPFISAKSPPSKFAQGVLGVLNSARWDVTIIPERDNRYVREIGGLEGTTFLAEMSGLLTPVDVNLNISQDESSLKVIGCSDQDSLRFLGNLVSSRGSIDYLDLKFKVDRVTLDFVENERLPWVQGRGETVFRDSTGITRNIYITLYVVDPVTKEKMVRGRWGDFILVLEDDAGSSQEQILAMMGYAPGEITNKMTSISGQIVSDAMLRRWIRPIERELEAFLKLDLVSLQPTIAQHLFENQILGTDPGPEQQMDWGAYFLRQSQFSVGKYLSNDVFLTYTGLWETGLNAQSERHFGFLHRWSVEYRIRPISKRLVVTLGYEYDSLEKLKDKEATLRYSILF